MLAELLCVAAVYACAVLYAHWIARHRRASRQRHYVLVAGNHQSQIEWYMRALQLHASRTGTDLRITVELDASTDETGAIVAQLAREADGIAWRQVAAASEAGGSARAPEEGNGAERLIRVDLAKAEQLGRLPI